MLILPVFELVPLRVRADVALFCVMFVTFEPTPPLIVTLPVPLPELVIVPVLFTEAVEIVMPLAVELLLLRVKSPVPVIPPVTERVAVLPLWLLTSVVPALFIAMAPTVRFEVELF